VNRIWCTDGSYQRPKFTSNGLEFALSEHEDSDSQFQQELRRQGPIILATVYVLVGRAAVAGCFES